MTKTTNTEVVTTKSHPLEKFFNIEPESTEVIRDERSTELMEHQDYDAKDAELEAAYQEILDAAMVSFNTLKILAEDSEVKTAIIATQASGDMLKTALAAVHGRADLKTKKDKLLAKAKAGAGKTTNNILIVEDRNKLLNQILAMPDDDFDDQVIDGESTKEN